MQRLYDAKDKYTPVRLYGAWTSSKELDQRQITAGHASMTHQLSGEETPLMLEYVHPPEKKERSVLHALKQPDLPWHKQRLSKYMSLLPLVHGAIHVHMEEHTCRWVYIYAFTEQYKCTWVHMEQHMCTWAYSHLLMEQYTLLMT